MRFADSMRRLPADYERQKPNDATRFTKNNLGKGLTSEKSCIIMGSTSQKPGRKEK
jgi:hypothetical protein